ncbi:MAG: TonB-dependent receptor [Sphingomonadales bacterium]|nr:TonB-dependent receptor [Sphingomonadales bacterium]
MHFDLSARVTLRGGFRYTHDDGAQTGLEANLLGSDNVSIATLIPPTSLSFSKDNVSGKIGLDYKPSHDLLFYANYAHGYRASSFNAQAFFDPSEVTIAKPESINAFEADAKTQFLDRRVTLNLAAFYYIYTNQRFINVEPATGAQLFVNVDRSRPYGGEGELTVRVSDRFSLRGGFGLLASKITRGTLDGVDLAGNRLANAPSVTLNAGIDATLFDDGATKVSFSPDVSYVSSQDFDVFNKLILKEGGYALLGAHLDVEHAPLSLSLWAKNAGNNYYHTWRIDLLSGFGLIYNHIGAPRTYGATVGFKF